MTGSEGEAAWTEELRARRKLTRHPSAIRLRVRVVALLVGSLVMGLGVALNTPPFRPAQWKFFAFFVGLAGLLIFTARGSLALYGLLRGRPVLTIDLEGVELGRRKLEWSRVQRISIRPSSPVLRYLAVGAPAVRIYGDRRSHHIDVKHDHIRDLESFADWLKRLQQGELRLSA